MPAHLLACLPAPRRLGALAVPQLPPRRPVGPVDTMTTPRRTLDRKPCPRCGRDVAWRVIRPLRVNRSRPIPPLLKPVRHKRWRVDQEPPLDWCPAGEP